MNIGFDALSCDAPAIHTWLGTWSGPPARLRPRASTAFLTKTPRAPLAAAEEEPFELEIDVQPGDQLRIETTTPAGQAWSDMALFERAPAGERLPAWESVTPP